MSNPNSRLVRVVIAPAIAGLLVAAGATAASADQGYPNYTLRYTGGVGAYPRSEPTYAAKVGSALPAGATIEGSCWTEGEAITNPYGYTSTVWVRSPNGQYWSEAWLETGSYGVPSGLPPCGPNSATPMQGVNESYNRTAAVKWAIANATLDPAYWWDPPGCTWFVSQALWAGGFATDSEWTPEGSHSTRRTQGSVTAWSAPNLVQYLERNYSVQLVPMDFSGNAVPLAEVGDVVAYDWENDGLIDHLAFVTGIAAGAYPEVSEWGTGANWYTQRGWTYSEINHDWLQVEHPNVSATLVHINGGVYLGEY